jgi:hypothetical protein
MPQELSVRIMSATQEWELGSTDVILPAANLVISVSGTSTRDVVLDGQAMRLSSARGLLAVDLTRSTGYHRLVVEGHEFWFGTEDAKLGLAGIEQMLAHLQTMGTGWTGQALFSDGSALRDPHVLYGWLDAWADPALTAASGVLAAPRSVASTTTALSRRGGPAVLLAPTLRLLRSSPERYLHENPGGGLIPVGTTSYDPLRVVVRRRTTTLETVANRRAVELLEWLSRLSREVLNSSPSRNVSVRCTLWRNRADALLLRPLARRLRAGRSTLGAARQPEEATTPVYRATYAIARDLRLGFGWSASLTPLPRFSYVERSDSIYQAYVATRLAAELGLTQRDPVLRSGSTKPAFSGPLYDLYYDTVCPPHVLRSWRAHSAVPDTSRPDLLLHERATGRLALLDAKYRLDPNKISASEDSRKEVTSYMGLYGLPSITIAYPGPSAGFRTLSGRGHNIIELPVTPDVANLGEMIPAVTDSLQLPAYL